MNINLRIPLFLLLLGFALHTAAQVPALNSNPSATATIFLDFDGHTVEGTPWNSTSALFCAGSGLNNAQINEIFDRVSEDYRPFNVKITTDSTVFLHAPINLRSRVIITTTSDWYPGVGGISFVGSFTWGDDTPCFVFSGALGYSTKNVAEAVSHEVGHTLYLYHQAVYDANCALVTSYNSGIGVGEIGWAPIMGVGYTKNFTVWHNGPDPYGCDQIQNDLEVITGYTGFGYRSDDHASTFTYADPTIFVDDQFSVKGIIERNTDQDFFKFNIPVSSRFTLDAVPYNVGLGNSGSDLDMQVTLYNSNQTPISVYNPGNTLSLVVDTLLNAGDYYAKVEGRGNAYAPAYASLGSYSLLAGLIHQTDPLPLRKLELKGMQDGDKHEFTWIVEADEKIISQTLEVSVNGKDFSALASPTATARSYVYLPSTSSTLLYRISVTFDNGRQNYSNTIAIRAQADKTYKPHVNGNIIHNSYLPVTSPGNYSFLITDITGKAITKGQIGNGSSSINTTTVVGGMYLISFTNGAEQWTEKFVRQ